MRCWLCCLRALDLHDHEAWLVVRLDRTVGILPGSEVIRHFFSPCRAICLASASFQIDWQLSNIHCRSASLSACTKVEKNAFRSITLWSGAMEVGTKRPVTAELFVRHLNQGRLMALGLDEARD